MSGKRMLRWALSLLLIVSTATVLAQDAEETFGCEANPTGNPIGGGEGYTDILSAGDFIVKTTAEFLAALKEAKPGQVIYVPDGTEIGQMLEPVEGGESGDRLCRLSLLGVWILRMRNAPPRAPAY